MKFRFRLAPLLKVAERNLAVAQEELATLERERRIVETEIERSVEERRLEDSELSHVSGGLEAGLFFHRRRSHSNSVAILRERRNEYLKVENEVRARLTTIKQEIYRLEKLREKARKQFLMDLRKMEDKELDEIGTLRYKRG